MESISSTGRNASHNKGAARAAIAAQAFLPVVAQRGFAANNGIAVVRRWFGCGFAAPWGRPSLLVVGPGQGRRRKPIVCPTLAKNRRSARRNKDLVAQAFVPVAQAFVPVWFLWLSFRLSNQTTQAGMPVLPHNSATI